MINNMFVGKSTPFTSGTSGGSDTSPPSPVDDITSENYRWDSMLGAKKVTSSDIAYALPRRNWTNSTVYDMYEDNISSSNTATSGASNLFDSIDCIKVLPEPHPRSTNIDLAS